ncbi:MAG: bifunctional aldolase/short-chain dehydrogenase [Bacillati bacterium ANGP1]|uniref:Bifunctional aldolase/short-chain dehydrogenase n=1 Tax=Candidatus Segetimicrobium genomatis TaxID=2569760 RepID=A0A537KTH6_9BACT|nr:MAG: bifunctional aldolase/short-chain dehydrogenase [Terrabacteria group bacterium ANGP1]
MLGNLWNDAAAARQPALDGLVYRSTLLARDRSVVNIFGGNTSAKLMDTDHLGRSVELLWVKGSGTDMAAITEAGFAALRLAEILPLTARDAMTDEEMVEYLTRCAAFPNRPRQSIETLLHAFLPASHVDHTHPDAVISLACASDGQALCRRLWGHRAVWVDYTRPGFTLSQWVSRGVRTAPQAELVVMGKHGLITWGQSSRECYERTIRQKVFSETAVPPLPPQTRRETLARLLPVLRGTVSRQRPAVLQVDENGPAVAFAGSEGAAALSQVGAACPDHLVHTKRVPLFVTWTPGEGIEPLLVRLPVAVDAYATAYARYFEEHRKSGDQMRDPYPRVIVIPGLGMITAGDDAHGADVSRQLYHRAIAVMEGSQRVGEFTSLTPQEAYDIEYWPLELYKLTLRPAPGELAGRVAVVTGGASGIGRATARRLARDGAHVAIFDINNAGAQTVAGELTERHGTGRGMAVHCDVTDEAAVAEAFRAVVLAYGGVDVVVSNAGIALSAPIDDTTLRDWTRTMDVLATGYFLISREAFRLWKDQRMGGSLIFVTSKNSVVASRNAAAYNTAKAAELHLARSLAEEGGPIGVRVNSVLPDAVLQDSGIWDAGWRQARAAAYGIKPEELDEYYRQRTVLKVNVLPEHVAEAISFLAGPRASRTTGAALTVDGGVTAAYLR